MRTKTDLSFMNEKKESIPVIEFVTGQRFDSVSKAAKHFGINTSTVRRSCINSSVTSGGLKFQYLDRWS